MPARGNGSPRILRSWRLLLSELGAFGMVGAGCFVIDLGLFQLLYAYAGSDAVLAKLGSTLVSMTVAFFGHRHWSFSHRARTGLRREYGIFFVINGLTMALGLAAVAFVHHALGYEAALVLQLTNVASIAVGTLIRFVAYRRWVFVAVDARTAVVHHRSQHARSAPPEDAPVTA